MSGNSKRRNSKWEHIDSEAFPESFYDRAPPRRPREPLSPGRGSRRHDNRAMAWDKEGNCSRISPELDERRPRHSSRSPRNGWGRSHRISKSRSRSRSRSPAHNFRQEPAINVRSRSRSGSSAQICRDFASGRCRRGNSCHFLHQDAQVYDNRRLECSPPDDYEGRHRRTGGSRYSPDDTKNNAIRTEKSAHICNDFLKGRCRRADCRYVHHDTAADVLEKGPVEDVYRNRDYESRSRDSYPDLDHRSRDNYLDPDRKRRDTYPDRNHECEPPKRGETPCKFFAAGNCRNGTRCRFSHEVLETFSPDRRSLDDRRGPDHKFEGSQGWDGPRWSDITTVSSVPDTQGWGEEKTENKEVNTMRSKGDGRGTRCRDVTTVSTFPDMKGWGEDNIENKEMSTVRTQSDGRAAGHKHENDRVWDGPSWSDTTVMPNVPVVHCWGEDKNETTEVAKEVNRARPGDDSWSRNMLDINQTWDTPATIDKSQIQDSKQPLQWKMETVVPGMGLPASRGIEKISGDMEISPRDIKQQGVNSSTLQTSSISNSVFPAVQRDVPGEVSYEKHYQVGFQEHKLFNDPFAQQNPVDRDNKPISFFGERGDGVGNRDGSSIIQSQPLHFSQGQSIFQPSHIVSAHPISNINPAGQTQLSLSLHPSRGEAIPLSHNASSFQENRAADGSHVISLAPSVLASGSATAPNTVSSEQLAQLTNLTASLTQLLESRQQLSHFSSAVTPQSVSNLPDLTAPVPLVSAPLSQTNEAPVVLKQYDPVFNSIEPKMHSLGNQQLPSVDQKSSYNEMHLEGVNVNQQKPLPLALTKEMHHEGVNVNQQNPLASTKDEESGQKAAEAKIKAPENGPSQDIGPDDGADGGKKLKDTKGIRPFKFALAEFVKELLKPAWKDGQVGKEAYKTIVKKVVDKVVETLGLQIPQTKEKIDLYLSCSKPKIEKLVQAYVGKHQKS